MKKGCKAEVNRFCEVKKGCVKEQGSEFKEGCMTEQRSESKGEKYGV